MTDQPLKFKDAVASEVLVLGAGFTKAFFGSAPLLNIPPPFGESLKNKFKGFREAERVLSVAIGPDGSVNLETLLTRLLNGMPYDGDLGVAGELDVLLREVKQRFLQLITKARDSLSDADVLAKLARHCVDNHITCITFNYDDFFDEALWKVNQITQANPGGIYWHPDGGYGFFCKPSGTLIGDLSLSMDLGYMHLLKLHGSVNWRIIRGAPTPRGVGTVVHHETWYPGWPDSVATLNEETQLLPAVLGQLEPEPLMIPPSLTKTDLVTEPLLSLVWWRAFEALRDAERVTFVGYSLPPTDFAAATLFRESMHRLSPDCICVVNTSDADVETKSAYRRIFPELEDPQFMLCGATEWARVVASK